MSFLSPGMQAALLLLLGIAAVGGVMALVLQKLWVKNDQRMRIFGLAGMLALFGAVVAVKASAEIKAPTNEWVEKTYPSKIGDYVTVQKREMDETSLQALSPMGYAWRVMTGKHMFEVLVLSSHERNSFHTPLDCFPAQDLKIINPRIVTLQTASRGPVPVEILTAQTPRSTSITVFTYEGPTAMHSANEGSWGFKQLRGDLFFSELKTARPQYGTFFRFMSLDAGAKEQDVLDFAKAYLDASPVRPIKG